MKRIILAFAMVAIVVTWTMAWAEDAVQPDTGKGVSFGFRQEDWEVEDCQFYLKGKDDRTEVGTGGCYGPLLELRVGNRVAVSFISIAGIATVSANEVNEDSKSDTGASGGIQVLNLMGLRVGGFYDLIRNLYFIGGGISFTGLAEQLLK